MPTITAITFVKWMGQHIVLPTEAEWEYACRAGTETVYYFGDDPSMLDQYAWFEENAVRANEPYAHEVGLKQPNPWGLFDLYGNVSEWCTDYFAEYTWTREPTKDPRGPPSGESRVLRGAAWSLSARACRSAMRGKSNARYHDKKGFRVVLDVASIKGSAKQGLDSPPEK